MAAGNKTGLLALTKTHRSLALIGVHSPCVTAAAAGVSLCAAARYYLHFYHRRRALP
jgi:hypothetical protein